MWQRISDIAYVLASQFLSMSWCYSVRSYQDNSGSLVMYWVIQKGKVAETDKNYPLISGAEHQILLLKHVRFSFFISNHLSNQAGAELGQAQLWLGSRYRQATIAEVWKICGKIRLKLVYWAWVELKMLCNVMFHNST